MSCIEAHTHTYSTHITHMHTHPGIHTCTHTHIQYTHNTHNTHEHTYTHSNACTSKFYKYIQIQLATCNNISIPYYTMIYLRSVTRLSWLTNLYYNAIATQSG